LNGSQFAVDDHASNFKGKRFRGIKSFFDCATSEFSCDGFSAANAAVLVCASGPCFSCRLWKPTDHIATQASSDVLAISVGQCTVKALN
jgi:hypothetical protein